jgi:hypothetical protein
LEFTEIFHEFGQQVSELVEGFVASNGGRLAVFLNECRDSLDDKWCALFQEDDNKWVVEIMLAATDYDLFYRAMASEILMDLFLCVPSRVLAGGRASTRKKSSHK